MVKLQQFKIIKFESGRLKEYKYNIKSLSLEQAKINGEIISIADSQMIRSLRSITKRPFSQVSLNELIDKKDLLSKRKNTKEFRTAIKSLVKEIDDILFIPEIISVFFESKGHYKKILDSGGFRVNGNLYVPFMASAGMVRRSSALFIDASIKQELEVRLNNGREKGLEISPAKFNSYYALASSSSLPVTFPNMAVVPDCIIKTMRRVDYSTYVGEGIDPEIKEVEMEVECNAFDGQGLISPSLARKWSRDLEVDYVISSAIVRAAFLKGMVVTFDFLGFAEKVANKTEIIDIYGNTIDIRSVDCIISQSMFKLWESYSSTEDYITKSKENGFGFSISKINPKIDRTHAKSSYQFLQILNLNDEKDIEELCEPTLSWISSVSGGSLENALLYSLGDMEFSKGWFKRLDHTVQAMLLNEKAIDDSYIIGHLDKSISKKKTDAKMGRLIFSGNYSLMISDPYAQAGHIFGLGISPLLKEHQHFSKYWNDREIKKVVAIRSPIVHSSECNILNLQCNDDVNYWYKHISSGIIFPAYGVGMDAAINGGSDHDGDLICTIHHPVFIKGKVEGLPILYDTKKSSKINIDSCKDTELTNAQIQGFGTKIGFYTNVGSSMYALLSEFPEGSKEREVLLNRLKYFRVLQGIAIDSAKGILTDPFPEHFVKYKKITDDTKQEDVDKIQFNNRILSDKRPMFMRWLYSHYNKKYTKELAVYNNISETKWGLSFESMLHSANLTDDQKKLVERYKRKSFFINNNSEMNRISRYVEEKLKEISKTRRISSNDFDYRIYLSSDYSKPLKRDVEKLKLLFKEWKSLKKSCRDNYSTMTKEDYGTIEQLSIHINRKAYSTISSNSRELADLAVYLTYEVFNKSAKAFAWQVFGREIIQNMMDKRKEKFVRVPQKSEYGIDYLWSKYGIYLVNIEE